MVLKYADALPAQALPPTPADWAAYRRLADGLDTRARLTGIAPSKLLCWIPAPPTASCGWWS